MLLFLYGLTRKSINLILFLLSILLNAPVKVLSLETALEYKLYISKDQYGFHRLMFKNGISVYIKLLHLRYCHKCINKRKCTYKKIKQ